MLVIINIHKFKQKTYPFKRLNRLSSKKKLQKHNKYKDITLKHNGIIYIKLYIFGGWTTKHNYFFFLQQLTLRFKFPIIGGYWSLTSVEVEDASLVRTILNVVGKPPTAPIGFSYKCSETLVFRHNSTYIKINNIQVRKIYFLLINFMYSFFFLLLLWVLWVNYKFTAKIIA